MATTKMDKTPVETETGSEPADFYPESSRSLDSLREMRLLALLHDMITAEDGAKAAKALGVSYRTVSRTVESGRLSERMAAMLERHLLLGGGSAAAQQRERVEALEKGLAELAEELRDGLKTVVGEVKAFREEHVRAMRYVERRLVALESGRNRVETPAPVVPESDPERKYVPPRKYPQLVTVEAEEGEERVYGHATPVIVEWREARAKYLRAAKTGTELVKVEAEMGMMRLEITLIEKHELTLPRASYPWGGEERRSQVRDRNNDLIKLEVERNRALRRRWLRRFFTCGLWRN